MRNIQECLILHVPLYLFYVRLSALAGLPMLSGFDQKIYYRIIIYKWLKYVIVFVILLSLVVRYCIRCASVLFIFRFSSRSKRKADVSISLKDIKSRSFFFKSYFSNYHGINSECFGF